MLENIELRQRGTIAAADSTVAYECLENVADEKSEAKSFIYAAEHFRDLRLYVCTWNVMMQQPSFDLSDLVKFDAANQPDICLFGFQEVCSTPLQRIFDFFFYDPWTIELTNILASSDYVRFKSIRLVGIILLVFVKRSVLPYIRCSADDWIRTGFYNLWGNKGATACTINLGNFNLSFVNAHLSAHDYQLQTRVQEYSRIMARNFRFSTTNEKIDNQDYVIFFGDLNYRIVDLPRDQVLKIIETEKYDVLFENDQLKRSIRQLESFYGFNEGQIDFPPTFKFDQHSHVYDTSKKQRMPSYCDRILYRTRGSDDEEKSPLSCQTIAYNHIGNMTQSDHRPVYGIYNLKTINWLYQLPDVVFVDLSGTEDQNIEIKYQVSVKTVTHPSDWIGVYHVNFKCDRDYVTYVWAARIYELEQNEFKKDAIDVRISKDQRVERAVVLKQNYINNGVYVLGYFSYKSNNIIGLSEPIEINIV